MIILGKTRAYINAASYRGLRWIKINMITLNDMADVDLEHYEEIEDLMEKEGLSVDIR